MLFPSFKSGTSPHPASGLLWFLNCFSGVEGKGSEPSPLGFQAEVSDKQGVIGEMKSVVHIKTAGAWPCSAAETVVI